jgi:exodeoxyribonuclease V gamma subunit
MPMRAVPFRAVCLLGMNDGDFPRRTQHADFDLLALPGMARPGDRSRRDDDRYLMLEALLAARDKLYISWVGRNVRDNSEQPPSILVSQLRDYLAAGWDLSLEDLTTEHPLQPFSRKYFEQGGLLTYAREWRSAHGAAEPIASAPLPPFVPEPGFRLRLGDLARFVKEPVRSFFRERLQVSFDAHADSTEDAEPFNVEGLDYYRLAVAMLRDGGPLSGRDEIQARLQARADRLGREGCLPIGAFGDEIRTRLITELIPVRRCWIDVCARYPLPADKLPVTLEEDGLLLDDWIDGIHTDGTTAVWLAADPRNLTAGKDKAPRGDALIYWWIRQLAAAAAGHVVTGLLLGRDVLISMPPLDPAQSRDTLATLRSCWHEGMRRPLPVACKTALAVIAGQDARAAYDGSFNREGEAERDPCLARLWPDYAALTAEPDWPAFARAMYEPLAAWMQSDITVTPIAQEEETA